MSWDTENVLRFDNVGFRTLNEGDDFVVFCLGNIKRLQRGVGVFEKDRPIALADAAFPDGRASCHGPCSTAGRR